MSPNYYREKIKTNKHNPKNRTALVFKGWGRNQLVKGIREFMPMMAMFYTLTGFGLYRGIHLSKPSKWILKICTFIICKTYLKRKKCKKYRTLVNDMNVEALKGKCTNVYNHFHQWTHQKLRYINRWIEG